MDSCDLSCSISFEMKHSLSKISNRLNVRYIVNSTLWPQNNVTIFFFLTLVTTPGSLTPKETKETVTSVECTLRK